MPWPENTLQGVHGWLAIGSGSEVQRPDWGEIRASQSIVVLDPKWRVPENTPLTGLSPEGRIPLLSMPRETARYGCDDGFDVRDVTPLQGAHHAGMLWVVSPDFGDARGLQVEVTDQERGRTWRFGDRTVGLTKTGTHTAALWHGEPRQIVKRYDISAAAMRSTVAQMFVRVDDYLELLATNDLLRDGFFVPQVGGAWQVGPVVVVGLYWHSFEGVHFEALVLDDGKTTLEHLRYVYNCAF